jgi:hypothetical protein
VMRTSSTNQPAYRERRLSSRPTGNAGFPAGRSDHHGAYGRPADRSSDPPTLPIQHARCVKIVFGSGFQQDGQRLRPMKERTAGLNARTRCWK